MTQVREIHDRELLESFLRRDPVQNAYPLGYLDDNYREHCRFFGWWDDDELASLITLYYGLSRPGLFTAGRTDGIGATLRELRSELPEQVLGHIAEPHLPTVRAFYRENQALLDMSRMGLLRAEWTPNDGLHETERVIRLTHTDTAAILRIYAHWPDHFFEPFQLETGLYFGLRLPDGSLGSIAGTHTISERYDVAAIGNLVTRPDCRGRGFARLCTDRLLREVFQRVGLVTLDVQSGNEPAIRTYRHFGFQHHARFRDGLLSRR